MDAICSGNQGTSLGRDRAFHCHLPLNDPGLDLLQVVLWVHFRTEFVQTPLLRPFLKAKVAISRSKAFELVDPGVVSKQGCKWRQCVGINCELALGEAPDIEHYSFWMSQGYCN